MGEVEIGKEKVKIEFWNVAVLTKKTREFWEYIIGWDVINLIEMWKRKTGRD